MKLGSLFSIGKIVAKYKEFNKEEHKKMTVKEIIEILKQFPENAFINGYETGINIENKKESLGFIYAE